MSTTSSYTGTGKIVSELPESLQDIFTNAFECVARVDDNGVFLTINEPFAEVCGYLPEEMIAMTWREIVFADDLEQVESKYQEMLSSGRADIEIRGVRKNRSVFYMHLLLVKGLEQDNPGSFHYCFINDITSRLVDELTVLKSVKTGLEHQEEKFLTLLNDIPGVVFQSNHTDYWSFTFLSPGIEKILGIPSYLLLANGPTKYESLIHEEDLDRVKQTIDAAVAMQRGYEVEYRIKHLRGDYRWFRERAASRDVESGCNARISGIIRDISTEVREGRSLTRDISVLKSLEDEITEKNRAIELLQKITYAANKATSVDSIIQQGLAYICRYYNWPLGHAYLLDETSLQMESSGIWYSTSNKTYAEFIRVTERTTCAKGRGLPGRVLKHREPIWIEDIASDSDFARKDIARKTGLTSGFGLPVQVGERVVAVLEFFSPDFIIKNQKLMNTLTPIGVQIGRTIERKQSDLALSQSQVNFDRAIKASPDCVMIIRLHDGKIIEANDAVQVTTGYTRAELINDCDGWTLWENTDSCKCFLKIMKESGKVESHRMLVRRKDGYMVPGLLSSTYMEVDGVTCTFNILKDVPDLVMAREEIRVKEGQTEIVKESTSVFLSYLDPDLIYVYNNMDFENEMGLTDGSVLGKSVQEVVGDDRYLEIEPRLQRALTGEDVKFEIQVDRAGSEIVCYEITYHPDIDDEEVIGIYVASTNITSRKKTELRLEKTSKAIQVLHSCEKAMASARTDDELLQDICNIVTEKEAYQGAWITLSGEKTEELGKVVASSSQDETPVPPVKRIMRGKPNTKFLSEVISTGRPVVVRNPYNWISESKGAHMGETYGTSSVLGLPIISRNQVLGVLVVNSLELDSFDRAEIETLSTIARSLASVLLVNGEREQQNRMYRRVEVENRLHQLFLTSPGLDEVLNAVVSELGSYCKDIDCSYLFLHEEDRKLRDGCSPLVQRGYINSLLELDIETNQGPWAHVAREGLAIMIDDTATNNKWKEYCALEREHNYKSLYIAPVNNSDNEVVGLLGLLGNNSGARNDDEIELVSRVLNIIRNFAGSQVEKAEAETDALNLPGEAYVNSPSPGAQEKESKLRALYDDSPAIFLTLDETGVIISINKFGEEQLGYSPKSLFNRPLQEIVHRDDFDNFMGKLRTCVQMPLKIQRHELRFRHKYNEFIWIRASMRAINTGGGQRRILVTCEDISEAKILSEQLEYQARHDALTGLINRIEFEKRLRRILNSPGDTTEHAVCYLDLDQFKVINDTCGHLAGDELIRRVSDILNTVVRKRDTLARMGGDEFAVLLEHCTLEQAKRVAVELLRSIETLRFVWDGKRFSLSVSIGLVPMRAGSGSIIDILGAADEACYAAKDGGRNRIHIYRSDDVELSRRRSEMEWVSEINHALEEDRFKLEAQQIRSLSDEESSIECVRYEILLRMLDTRGGVVLPGAFLPAAERYNLSVKIDQWVVSHALDWLAREEALLQSLSMCCINLSGHSMGDESFLKFLLKQFGSKRVPADRICFEITETAAIANLGDAIQFIKALKEIGCLFALDDFGSGVSSFNYLKNLPVDYLKIDGSFIREIHNDPIDYGMVRSISEIGRIMGKLTIAEFVENKEVLDVVKELGIDYAQGYAIARPVAIEQIRA